MSAGIYSADGGGGPIGEYPPPGVPPAKEGFMPISVSSERFLRGGQLVRSQQPTTTPSGFLLCRGEPGAEIAIVVLFYRGAVRRQFQGLLVGENGSDVSDVELGSIVSVDLENWRGAGPFERRRQLTPGLPQEGKKATVLSHGAQPQSQITIRQGLGENVLSDRKVFFDLTNQVVRSGQLPILISPLQRFREIILFVPVERGRRDAVPFRYRPKTPLCQ